jgi:hypothetical protein
MNPQWTLVVAVSLFVRSTQEESQKYWRALQNA